MSVSVWVREITWIIEKNSVAEITHTFAPKITTIEIPEFRAQTRFPGKPRIYPHTLADRPLKTVPSGAQRRSNRRTSCSRTEFSDLHRKPRKSRVLKILDPAKTRGTQN